ncbi:MAG: N-acetyltransferase [Bacteroidales bacterium]|nr:N-acetyltransferase [Bacteroidales bacterium]
MRTHPDFIQMLDFVAVFEDNIIGNIMYTNSYIIDGLNNRIETITFGPVSVLPEYQKRGVGSALIRHSIQVAYDNHHKAIIIEGHPHNCCKHGFKSCKDYNIGDSEGKYPYSLLVLELEKDFLAGTHWSYYASDVYLIDENAADEYDKLFEWKKKEYKYTQEEFFIASRAYIA